MDIHKSALKWTGGKSRVLKHLKPHLKNKKELRLVEPFLGSASVFLNTPARDYLLSDINSDLINFYRQLRKNSLKFIDNAYELFMLNSEEDYYCLRDEFNQSHDDYRRALLFLYLNRHGYKGLWRVNSDGHCNVPYGHYKAPYFPQQELSYMAFRLCTAELRCCHFQESINNAGYGDLIYADPPYVPVSKTANFTGYHHTGFNWVDQVDLAERLLQANRRGARVVLSNSATTLSLKLYQDMGFKLEKFTVLRSINSVTSGRKEAKELIAWIK